MMSASAGSGALLIARAADYAARQHAGQRRKGVAAEPYVNHLAEVALLLAEASEGDPTLIALGWLHDTVEDSDTEHDELARRFGKEIADLVAEVTDDKRIEKSERKRLQVETTPKKSPRAKMLKIADKTSNLRSLITSPPDKWERERLLDYIDWAEKVVAGARGVNAALERIFDETVARARTEI